jgi:hypothetical protein
VALLFRCEIHELSSSDGDSDGGVSAVAGTLVLGEFLALFGDFFDFRGDLDLADAFAFFGVAATIWNTNVRENKCQVHVQSE